MRIASQASGWTGETGCAGTNAGKATAKDAKGMRGEELNHDGTADTTRGELISL